ncbi:MAG TPA: TVP38/TMEM64 family protein [Planctomycetota bacterium]|nr:TVP38/TMEM64 family protein [Planctomycetota bacterium]
MSAEPPQTATGETTREPPRSVAWLGAALLLITVLTIAFALLPVAEWLSAFRDHIKALGAAGFLAYILLYIACASLLIPCTAMGLMAGYLFGLLWGVPAAIIGGNLGAWSAFLLGRTLLRSRVELWARERPRFTAVESAVSENAFKIILCLRLSPIFGYTWMNYLLSLTSVPFWKFALATVIGMLPGNFAFVYLGTLPDEMQKERPIGIRLLQVAGVLALVVGTILISRIARRALNSSVSSNE